MIIKLLFSWILLLVSVICSENINDLCNEPKKVGPCRRAVNRYFYNSASGKCELFSWGGCHPNRNNFMTFAECTDTCYKPCKPGKNCSLDYCPLGPVHNKHGCVKKCVCACPCQNIRCKKGEMCIEQDVVCESPPCSPLPVCVDKKICKFGLPGNSCGHDRDCKDGQFCFKQKKGGICCDKDANPCEYGSRGRRCSQKGIACPSGQECILDEGRSEGWCCASSVCALPPDSGCGRKKKMLWYYNPETYRCHQFRYGGKGGNKNRFSSAEKCEKECKKCTAVACALACDNGFMEDKFGCHKCRCKPLCSVYDCPPNSVALPNCEKDWYWCHTFFGCECIDICYLPKNIGLCNGTFPKWYHNPVTGTCEQFDYGGCHGNENRFNSLKKCEKKCGVIKCRINDPEKQCKISCPHGYEHDENGCVICQCFDPHSCYEGKCAKDEICELRKVYCASAPCPPIAFCIRKCNTGKPLTDAFGVELFCGRGKSRKCPRGASCVIDPVDRFAVCCPKSTPGI